MWKSEPVPDEKLVARIRSKMGRYVSHPHAVHVEANNGEVTLSGSILAHEASKFLRCVKGIAGVGNVNNLLDVQDLGSAASNPNLLGEGSCTGENWEFMNKNWSPATRLMASAVGGGLLLYGMKSRSRIGTATSALGLGLLTRGITNREMADIKGIGALRRLVHV
jgi:hypothetical protein